MAKRKYKSGSNAGDIMRDHDAKVIEAIREIVAKEEKTGTSHSDVQLCEMLLEQGLLVSQNVVYRNRLDNDIPNSRERAILNFAKKHKGTSKTNK